MHLQETPSAFMHYISSDGYETISGFYEVLLLNSFSKKYLAIWNFSNLKIAEYKRNYRVYKNWNIGKFYLHRSKFTLLLILNYFQY